MACLASCQQLACARAACTCEHWIKAKYAIAVKSNWCHAECVPVGTINESIAQAHTGLVKRFAVIQQNSQGDQRDKQACDQQEGNPKEA